MQILMPFIKVSLWSDKMAGNKNMKENWFPSEIKLITIFYKFI